jgi:Met-zincin
LSKAYATGVGAYDVWAIQYGYGQWAPGDEAAALSQVVEDGLRRGLLFVSDEDARGLGTAHALGALWDNGSDPIDALKAQIEVRRLALARFGLASLPEGLPLSLLEARLLPIYLLHRYQVNAAAKSVGGTTFTYAVKTAAGPSPAPALAIVSPERQRAALAALLETIDPQFLALPQKLLDLIPPTAYGYGTGTAEPFPRHTTTVFDSIGAASIAADFAVSALLQPERAARLVEFHGRDERNPAFDEVASAIVTKAFGAMPRSVTPGVIARAVQQLVATRLTELASNERAAFEVRAGARQALQLASRRLSARTDAAGVVLRQTIDRYLTQPTPPTPTPPLPTPQGEPIG